MEVEGREAVADDEVRPGGADEVAWEPLLVGVPGRGGDRAEVLRQHLAAVDVAHDVREELTLDVVLLDRAAPEYPGEGVAALPAPRDPPRDGAQGLRRRRVV